jgi:hypothetical protein
MLALTSHDTSARLHARQESFQSLAVGPVTNPRFSQGPFPFPGLFRQDVAAIGFGIDELARFGPLEPLGGGAIGFYFRHCDTPRYLINFLKFSILP